ncbi:MAG: septum formation initiator family protein [bacterium]|nr:septum formation initiator family protein [bacterium]
MVLLVAAVAFALLAPTLRLYLQQQAAESRISEELAAAEARNAQLEREIARWSDPAFIQAQARDRLGYVMPGQQPYTVVDPEVVVGEEAQAEYEALHAPAERPLGPWYLEVWDSIAIAGGTEVTDREGAPDSGEGAPEGDQPAVEGEVPAEAEQ